MPLRLVEITAPADNTARIKEIATDHSALDSWHSAKNQDGRRTVRILVTLEEQQGLTDDLQKAMHKEENWRIVVQPVEATIPQQEDRLDKETRNANKVVRGSITREELYNEVRKGARTDLNFILLVILSTIVCAIGLIENNVAVIIGAMVIAPLLGPYLALAFGAALGDTVMIKDSIKSNLAGLGLTLGLSVLAGLIIPLHDIGPEIMDRTEVGYGSLLLALAAGAAAVLSLTTGLSSALVGVMVAVALMPPAVTLGLMAGAGDTSAAYGAALLLTANVVCISIAAQLVFFIKGIKPRTWYQRRKSAQSVKWSFALWAGLLALLIVLIYIRQF